MPESLTRRARPFDLRAPDVMAGITSEQWPASVRNGGRLQIGIPAGMHRNLEASVRSRGTTVGMRVPAKATSLKPD